jgi:hypothetical protein
MAGHKCERKWVACTSGGVRWKQNKDISEREFGI